jgi:hypothetical protein
MERTFAQMGDVVQKIIHEVKKKVGFNLLTMPHHYCVVASIVQSICLSKLNGIMHPGMVFHCINDDLSNSMHQRRTNMKPSKTCKHS